ncbi:hypothetical protein LRD18_11330, partial [Halorhodospira halochloris]|uniref:hypothetical protein n=1 Tax=Halorhodospira halochloris TaxID=1052 RepID=UPI001EE93FB6
MGLSNLPPMMSADRMDKLESNRELVMAAYVMRGELDRPDDMEDDTWEALVAGEMELDDAELHEGEARTEYWLGRLDSGLSGDELLGQMLYEASYGNDGLNTDESNIQFRQAMSEKLKAKLDAGEIEDDNLLDVAGAARKEAGDSVAANFSMSLEDAAEGDLPVWFSIEDTAEQMVAALDDEDSPLWAAQVSWPSDYDEASDEDRAALRDALGDRFEADPPEGYEPPEPPPEGDWDAELPIGERSVSVDAQAGESIFFFDVGAAREHEDATQIVFQNFDEDYELLLGMPELFEMPEEFDGEPQTLADLHGVDLGDGEQAVVQGLDAPDAEPPRVEIFTQWGSNADEGAQPVTLQLLGVTDPEDVQIDIVDS